MVRSSCCADGVRRHREAEPLARREVGLSDRARQRPHAADVAGPLGHGDRAAGIQQVEGVAALHDHLVGRQRELDGDQPLRLVKTSIATAAGVTLPAGFLTAYVQDIVRTRATTAGGAHAESGASGDLLEAYAARMRGEHEFGWFMIDLMLKVGFVGTLIGFIWMLSSVSKQSVIDAASMQQILKDMSYGMSIALNTTLTSLVTATLLSAPYYLLNRGLDELLECTVRLTQVEILPRLNTAA